MAKNDLRIPPLRAPMSVDSRGGLANREWAHWFSDLQTALNAAAAKAEEAPAGADPMQGNVAVIGPDGDPVDSGRPAPIGQFVGDMDTQTLGNKTLLTPDLYMPSIADFKYAQHTHAGSDPAHQGGQIPESALALSDIADNNADVSGHGFCPKLSGDANTFLNGLGSWVTPSGGGVGAHQLDGAAHTVSGLTPGTFLKATGAATFGFAAHGLAQDDIPDGASYSQYSFVDKAKVDVIYIQPFNCAADLADQLEDAVTALPSTGGIIQFPNTTGQWNLSRTVTITKDNVLIRGCGMGLATPIVTTDSTYSALVFDADNGRVENLTIVAEGNATGSGFAISTTAAATNFRVQDVEIYGYANGIQLKSLRFAVDRCIVRVVQTTNGVAVQVDQSGVGDGIGTIDRLYVENASGSQGAAGIELVHAVAVTISECQIMQMVAGLKAAPGSGKIVQWVDVSHCWFDSGTDGVYLSGAGTGTVKSIGFDSCWFSGNTNYGVNLVAGGTAMGEIRITGDTRIFGNASAGINMADSLGGGGFYVLGASFTGNTNYDVHIGQSNTNWYLIGCRSGALNGYSASTAGLLIDTGCSAYINQHNIWHDATDNAGSPLAEPVAAHALVGASHTAAGLTTGHFLKATGATTFAFGAHGLTAADVGADASGAAATVQGNLTTHIGLTGTSVHGLGSSATHADSDFVAANGAIAGATKTKITYDAKGLVTGGADATQDDIGDGATYKQYNPASVAITAGTVDGLTLLGVKKTNTGGSSQPILLRQTTTIDSDTTSYDYLFTANAYKQVLNSHTDGGRLYAFNFSAMRNYTGAGVDNGTMSILSAMMASYGHYNGNASADPQTTTVYGLSLTGVAYYGDIGTMYHISVGSSGTGSLITTEYGLYLGALRGGTKYSIYQVGSGDVNFWGGAFLGGQNSAPTVGANQWGLNGADVVAGNTAATFTSEAGHVRKMFSGAHVTDADATSISALTGTLGTTGTALVAATGTYASDYANLNNNDRRLMDQVNNLRTVVNSLRTQFNTVLTRLEAEGLLLAA